jgi:hypothetical protein
MDTDRFDAMTRRLANGATTRRRMLRGFGGTAAGAVLAGLGVRPAAAAIQDAGVIATHGRHAGTALGVHAVGTCENCDAMCTNCPVGCCLA